MDKKHCLSGPFKDTKITLQGLNIIEYLKAEATRSKRSQAKWILILPAGPQGH